jgi:hypothetical protein
MGWWLRDDQLDPTLSRLGRWWRILAGIRFAIGFSFSVKACKSGGRVILVIMTYLSGPTSVLHVPAADLIGHRGMKLRGCNVDGCLVLDGKR